MLRRARLSRRRPGRLPLTLAAALLAGDAALLLVASASADYDPSTFGHPFSHHIGAGGAQVQTQGTPLDSSDALGAWNSWTSRSKLSSGTSCSTGCIIYANSGATLYYTTCVVPYPISGAWADTRVAAGMVENNLGCTSLGSDTYPIFVVNYYSAPSYGYLHVQRHEMGHALGLNDANVACWSWWVGYQPLMNDGMFGNCSGFPYNYTATANEASYVVSTDGW